MLGVSTCWLSRSVSDPNEIVERIAALDVSFIELDYRMSPETFFGVLRVCNAMDITLASIHAVAPAPANKPSPQFAEKYFLCSEDEDERKMAVRDVASTLELAADCGAGAVVIHSGFVAMERATLKLQNAYDQGKTGSAHGKHIVNEARIDRLGSRGKSFDMLLKSLDQLNHVAERLTVNIGVENRYYLREYPNFEEFAIIFRRFAGGNIKYWHDTGHAKAGENLGICPHEAYLKEFGEEMIGVHLHDVDRYTDHFPPPYGGEDGVDFNMVKKYLQPGVIRILEIKDGIADAQALASIKWLKEMGIA